MKRNKHKIAIVGASGFTGSELTRLLASHPEVEIKHITSESHAGKAFSELHPQFLNIVDLTLEKADIIDTADLDIIFLALPHGVSMEFVGRWKDKNAKIIDLSGDFRLRSPAVYEAWYQKKHSFQEGFSNAVYGLPELTGEKVKSSQLIANPGCYPTASILSVAPLFANKLVENDTLIIDAKSGLTGAGIKASDTTHFSNVNENFKPYGIGSHRHTIEIEEQLSTLCEEGVTVQFTPHLLPVDRGILVTSYAKPKNEIDSEQLRKVYDDFYQEHPFIRIRDKAPSLKDVRGSHYCDIYPFWDSRTKRIISIAVIDNLLKGAASEAVHNMNLMLGIDQQTGLKQIPLKP
ncbi:N-acetyl-gamma-glutamyl-phosphate reductase [Arthrospiribacter ruber]|uniref:N-acetyl-gamma-glutamyl-phosphate reductase n=1 Tax=Arthrospiribacter ruber TaxID=2487934 RepID=A0A951MEU1_9BACT|nr:N-acetyl-gamma-glutamyl-phosphate reductase [Arthrospiribacter ruber]MBW3468670.1 N-acetyl-gamma-glutamyl-phosphate reductase [Arthrospiribacter ruber]